METAAEKIKAAIAKEKAGMGLMIYNTMSRQKEPFETLEQGKVRMYVCGPTVYDKAHVGHAMSSVVFDIIRRYLEYKGYRVTHVMNYTDIEDKVIDRANKLGVDPIGLAETHIAEYDQHLTDLNVLPATYTPHASKEIPRIIEMIQGLIDLGFGYAVDGNVYFRVSKDKSYGRLSRRKLEDMRAGFRLEVDERKEDPADFALWKAAKPGEPAWDTPWGKGRPGWHIECSAMSLQYLGEQIDIHGGGNDLIFPHHENEIAQTESLTGKPFARYWVHNGMLQLAGEKMSKSIGNLITVDEFLSEHEADAFRMIVLNTHYRGPLAFNTTIINQAERALERIRAALRPAVSSLDLSPDAAGALAAKAADVVSGFETAMDDDFNTAGGLAQIFDLVRAINQARDAGIDAEELKSGQETLMKLAGILGLRLKDRGIKQKEAAVFIDLLVELRQQLRQSEQWDLADLVRGRLEEQGIIIEDNKDGTSWRSR